jgi:hypothetical protein
MISRISPIEQMAALQAAAVHEQRTCSCPGRPVSCSTSCLGWQQGLRGGFWLHIFIFCINFRCSNICMPFALLLLMLKLLRPPSGGARPMALMQGHEWFVCVCIVMYLYVCIVLHLCNVHVCIVMPFCLPGIHPCPSTAMRSLDSLMLCWRSS